MMVVILWWHDYVINDNEDMKMIINYDVMMVIKGDNMMLIQINGLV